MDKFILEQPWGGLGDNLQFSTLPELCYNNGIDFYLSSKNVYRNLEIEKLVWGNNPYVKGIIDEPSNAGGKFGDDMMRLMRQGYNHIESVELSHGLTPTNSLPKIYYQPKLNEFFSDKTVVCLGSVSNTYDGDVLINTVKDLVGGDDNVVELTFSYDICENNSIYGNHKEYNIGYEKYQLIDIFEHCDIIFSVKKYICLFSGNSVLSSAINKNNTIVITKHINLQNSKFYYFKNLKYITI